MTIDELAEVLKPLVMQHAPDSCSLGKAREIAQDCAYMIRRGRSLSMTGEAQKREDLKVDGILQRAGK